MDSSAVVKVFDGKELTFQYNPSEIRTNENHWWLKIYSEDSRNLRSAIGLSPDPYWGLHLTLGYVNNKNLAHSKYILECIKKFNL